MLIKTKFGMPPSSSPDSKNQTANKNRTTCVRPFVYRSVVLLKAPFSHLSAEKMPFATAILNLDTRLQLKRSQSHAYKRILRLMEQNHVEIVKSNPNNLIHV